MADDRLDALRAMVGKFPDDPRPRFFLGHELVKAGAFAEAVEHYRAYLALERGDVGAAWRELGRCLERTGASGEAAEAYRNGITSARANGHSGLASEIEMLLEELLR
jgi:cytochrome c-type biogenesis protein CcmH/NrfG